MWFGTQRQQKEYRKPAPACMPVLPDGQVAAVYQGARVGGDFFDFATVGSRLILLLMDVAGRREEALDISAAVQDRFRAQVPVLFQSEELNESDAITALAIDLNRTVIEAAGDVHCSPGFLACYEHALGTLTYVNAGHIPALVRDSAGISQLDASGLPLGLFSHATHDAQIAVLEPGAVLLLASRGLVEARSRGHEFGLERVKQCLASAALASAEQICRCVLQKVREFIEQGHRHNFFGMGNGNPLFGFGKNGHSENGNDFEPPNDLTTVALLRTGGDS